MEPFEDYYEILQVHYLAEPEVIEAAYKKLAQKYHPDINKSSATTEKMKKINIAHDILSVPEKRKSYNIEWLKRNGPISKSEGASTSAKPKPILEITPRHIRFKDLGHLDIKTTYFDIKNAGGPFTNYTIVKDYLQNWLAITEVRRLTNQALPVRVTITATGQQLGSQYECYIPIKIENKESHYSEELKVHIELVMKGSALQIDRNLIEFHLVPGITPTVQTITIQNIGVGYVEGNLMSREQWIKVSPRSLRFNDRQNIQVQIDASKLTHDSIGHIEVKTNAGDEVVIVKAILQYQSSKAPQEKGQDPIAAPFTLYRCPKCKKNTIWFNRHNNKYECLKCKRLWQTPNDIK